MSESPKPMTNDNDLHDLVFDLVCSKGIKNIEIADLGAGQGAFTHKLINNGFTNVSPYDITDKYWKLDGLRPQIIDFNLDFCTKVTKQFDIICAIEVIEHVESPYHFLRNCHRLLKEDGMLIITTPNVETFSSRMIFLWNGYLRYFSEEELNHHHVTPLFSWYLRHAFRKIGFSNEKVFFTSDKVQISDSFKGKVAEKLLLPLRMLLKGDKKGLNRIHTVHKGAYREPVSL